MRRLLSVFLVMCMFVSSAYAEDFIDWSGHDKDEIYAEIDESIDNMLSVNSENPLLSVTSWSRNDDYTEIIVNSSSDSQSIVDIFFIIGIAFTMDKCYSIIGQEYFHPGEEVNIQYVLNSGEVIVFNVAEAMNDPQVQSMLDTEN